MWIYSQSSGNLWNPELDIESTGYSGADEGKNNPRLDDVVNIGPIPRGEWLITSVYNSKKVGPYALRLVPHKHKAHLRTYFRIHGDNAETMGQSSKGCIILKRSIRQCVWDSGDRVLLVIQ